MAMISWSGCKLTTTRVACLIGAEMVITARCDAQLHLDAEKGTEAAAATGVVLGTTSLPVGLDVYVNRPFLYFLRDQPTGTILFMGRVVDPTKS